MNPAGRLNPKQIIEWTENPVTLELLRLIDREVENILLTPAADCLCYGDPNKTHEELIKQDTRAHTLATLHFALEGDWSSFEEIDDDSYEIEDTDFE
jgi:hypothetical protein